VRAPLATKEFLNFSADEIGDEAIIGGIDRHKTIEPPSEMKLSENLVIPSRPETVAWFGDWLEDRPLVIEVGSGKGRFLTELAAKRPDVRFLGFETRLGLCEVVLKRSSKAGLENVAMAWGDARVNIPLLVKPATAIEAYLLFPDPWWKKRHARRRHGPAMSKAVADALIPGGIFVIKSDIPEYLDSMVATFANTGDWRDAPVPQDLPLTDRQSRISFQGTNSFAYAFYRI
jgi:tRNA (guanine-N7-)-methyltransferase